MRYQYRFLTGVAAVLLCLLGACNLVNKRPSVAVVSPHLQYDPGVFQAAAKHYERDLSVDLFGVSEGKLPVFSVEALRGHDLVIFEGMGARISLVQPQIDSLKAFTKVLFLDSASLVQGNVALKDYPDLTAYWTNGNAVNYDGMLSYLAREVFHKDVQVQPPVRYPDNGFYYPGIDTLFPSADSYLEWYNKRHPAAGDQLAVGLVFYQSSFVKNDLAFVDALIKNVEQHGARPVTLLAKGAFQLDSFFMKEHHSIVDVVIYGGMFLNFSHPEKGRAGAAQLDVPLLGAATHYTKSRTEWEQEPGGFSPDLSDRFYFTERDGVFEPMLIAAAEPDINGQRHTLPVDYQVNWRVERALSWARLRHTANRDKKLVCTYYSEGNGKASAGADIDAYLDVPASINRLLHALKDSGYNVGSGPIPDAAAIAKQMSTHASNVGTWAPAELQQRAAAGEVITIPESLYRQWFSQYPAGQQQQVLQQWGAAPGKLQVLTDSTGAKSIVIPVLRYGNIVFAPHPNWGLQDNTSLIYGKSAITPSHAYIGFYEWMKHVYQPHAFISLFTQLSLMPGKQEGPSAKDFVGELIGNVPHISLAPLIANGGVANKRRTNALTIGYITHISDADLPDALRQLSRNIANWSSATNPAIKSKLQQEILTAGNTLKLQQDIGATPAMQQQPEAYIEQIRRYLVKLAKQRIPEGGHILGEPPGGETLVDMVAGMLGQEFTTRLSAGTNPSQAKPVLRALLLQNQRIASLVQAHGNDTLLARQLNLALSYKQQLLQTPAEITQILRALDGRYIIPGPAGDPVSDPAAVPGGRDVYSGNDKAMPSKEAWALGERLADQLLLQFERTHGKGAYPQKVAFVLWSSEITHTQGVTEAEILALLGVQPVWNSKGQVMDVSLIPGAALKRPRIDVLVTTSGTYRDHFADKIHLLDKAVRLAAHAGDTNNLVRAHTIRYREALHVEDAVAALRIFSSAEGAFSTNLEFATENGEGWKNDTTLSNLYLDRMAHAYGEQYNSSYQKELFALNIKDVDAAAFSRSSSVYGIMDHPMVAAYFGAYNLAVKNTTGKQPDLFINDLQDTASAEVTPINTFFHMELRSHYLNPKWIKGMMDHGYDGARYMESFSENIFLWDVTTPDLVTNDDWNEVYATYVEDKHQLGLKHYFETQNPYAQQSMLSTMLEASEKGYWKASEQQLAAMSTRLASSVAASGLACNTAVCNSPSLSRYVEQQLERVPGAGNIAQAYKNKLVQIKRVPGSSPASGAGQPVSGQAMTTRVQEQSVAARPAGNTLMALAGLLLLIILFMWGWCRK